MRWITLFPLLFIAAAGNSSYDISSDDAQFEAGCATLLYNVAITIDGTKICCDRAKVLLAKDEKKQTMPFDTIDVEGNISITTDNGAVIKCDRAHLEGVAGRLDFFGNPVTFVDCKSSLTVKSKEMQLWFSPNAHNNRCTIRQIDAIGDVSIIEEGKFTASGEFAEYLPTPSKRSLTLYPSIEGGAERENGDRRCKLTTAERGSAKMKKALFSIDSKELFLEGVEGDVTRDTATNEKLYFTASLLYWNEEEMTISLHDGVRLLKPGEGEMNSDDRILMQWSALPAGGKLLTHIAALGKSSITTLDNEGDERFTIDNDGTTVVDLLAATLSAVAANGCEIRYRDRMGHAFGREAKANLLPSPSGWMTKELTLSNDVKLLVGGLLIDGELKGASQYILADSVKYRADRQTITLNSRKKRRVLYYDRINNVQMSAPKLVVKKEKGSDKPTIRGDGNVRLKLLEQEVDLLKKRFNME